MCARSTAPRRPWRCATASARPARWRSHAGVRWTSWPRPRRRCRTAVWATGSVRRSSWWPTPSSTATRRALEVLGHDVPVGERGDEALDVLFHVRLHQALQVADEGLGTTIELLVEPLDD